MNILIIGAGGREHALAWKIQQSPLCTNLFVAPGNAGTEKIAKNIPLIVTDFEGIAKFVTTEDIEMIVVGPEEPLVKGFRNFFSELPNLTKVHIIGPDHKGALLEGSKDFSKRFMLKYGIPTANAKTFTIDSLQHGLEYLDAIQLPIVLKADGLAAGKGVLICPTHEEAKTNLTQMLSEKMFGEASHKVLVEEFLEGIELSVFIITDGKNYVTLPEAKDYKRIGEGETGLNTGGMGAVSPVGFADKHFMNKVHQKIIEPTIRGLQQEQIDYIGFIFIGLMNVDGEPYAIEYNIRLGDPEAQVVLPRIKSDLVELLMATAERRLQNEKLEIFDQTASTVVVVAEGYPGTYKTGKIINNLDKITRANAFHAGTATNKNNQIITNGGRVIAMTGLGENLKEALEISFEAADTVHWDGLYFRRDIGKDLLVTPPL